MEGTIMDVVWARTDIDLTGYRKVMFEGVDGAAGGQRAL